MTTTERILRLLLDQGWSMEKIRDEIGEEEFEKAFALLRRAFAEQEKQPPPLYSFEYQPRVKKPETISYMRFFARARS